jgi:membrane protein
MGRLNAVYGVLAAIPLFLIWMNFSWQIIIYGAELTRAFQEVDNISIPQWESEK